MTAKSIFNHFANTRHSKWTIIGVVSATGGTEVSTIEIFKPGVNEPVLSIAVSDLPQFIAGLTATALHGDLTAV